MSDSKKALYGNLQVPVTKDLRSQFKKVTQSFKQAVPQEVQVEMLKSHTTPEARLELLDHLIDLGVPVPDIHPRIRLSSELAQKLAMRVHYVRSRQTTEAPASRLAVV
jgi:hypothetical protein